MIDTYQIKKMYLINSYNYINFVIKFSKLLYIVRYIYFYKFFIKIYAKLSERKIKMKKEKQSKLVAVDLPLDLLEQLEKYCGNHYGISKSAVIRAAIKKVLDEDLLK